MLPVFLIGKLPWQDIQKSKTKTHHEWFFSCFYTNLLATWRKKLHSSNFIPLLKIVHHIRFDFATGYPLNSTTTWSFCRGLDFKEEPDYSYLVELLKSCLARHHQLNVETPEFPWGSRSLLQRRHALRRRKPRTPIIKQLAMPVLWNNQ